MIACPLCGADAPHADRVACGYWSCRECGMVYDPLGLPNTSEPSEGWRLRAAQIAVETPKSAARCPSVEHLASLLALGPVYVETPNTRDPQLSLHHFFRERLPAYYEPHTLAIAAIMAGAKDVAGLDEVAGNLCAVWIPGAPRKTYAEALAEFDSPPPQDVAQRMAHAFDRKVETLGDVVPGACFLCGGVRRAWRTAAICETCSTLTRIEQPPVIEELAVSISSAPPFTDRTFIGPAMRSSTADECEAIVTAQGWLVDEPGWPAALLMAGADMCNVSKRLSALRVSAVSNGAPRRKTIDEARELMKQPFREARHTVAIWSMGKRTASRFEVWMAGGEEPDVEYLRAEALRMHETATSAIAALEGISALAEVHAYDPDDWRSDEWLCGAKMGRAAAWLDVQSAVRAAISTLLEKATRT